VRRNDGAVREEDTDEVGHRAMKTLIWRLVLAAFLVGAVVGALMLSAAFDHNPQGEFIDQETGEVALLRGVLLFASWFVPAFVVVFAFGCLALIPPLVWRRAKTPHSRP